MNESQQLKKVSVMELATLREKIEITSETDVGLATVTLGKHAAAGLVVLIATPESQSCFAIAQDVASLLY